MVRVDSRGYQNHTVLLGEIDARRKLFWNWNTHNNCIITGERETGKTELARNIADHCQKRNIQTLISENYTDEGDRGEYYNFTSYSNEYAEDLLGSVWKMVITRLHLLENNSIQHFRPLVVILDNHRILDMEAQINNEFTQEEHQLQEELIRLMNLSQNVNIHFVLISDKLPYAIDGNPILDANALGVVMGLEMKSLTHLTNELSPGKGTAHYLNTHTRQREYQIFESYLVPKENN